MFSPMPTVMGKSMPVPSAPGLAGIARPPSSAPTANFSAGEAMSPISSGPIAPTMPPMKGTIAQRFGNDPRFPNRNLIASGQLRGSAQGGENYMDYTGRGLSGPAYMSAQ